MAIRFEYKKGKYYINGEEFNDRLEISLEHRHLFAQFQHALLRGIKIKSVVYKEKDNDKLKSRDSESQID